MDRIVAYLICICGIEATNKNIYKENRMKKRMNLYEICVIACIVAMMIPAAITFGQDNKVNIGGMNVDVSSGNNSVKINGDNVKVHTKDGALVRTRGPKVVTKSSSAVSAQSGTLTFSKDATISGRNINTDGDGLVLKGNGNYTVVNCNINAGKNAIIVSGNATVKIKDCVFNGSNSAILIKDSGTVTASKSVFNGKIKTLGNADYIDKGGNVNNSF
jgi:uncharacterized protein with beta-barrel porin domain